MQQSFRKDLTGFRNSTEEVLLLKYHYQIRLWEHRPDSPCYAMDIDSRHFISTARLRKMQGALGNAPEEFNKQ